MGSRSVLRRFRIFSKKSPIFYLGICCFLLTGCHIDHDLHNRPYCLECTDLKENVGEALASNSVTEGYWDCPDWWQFFQDPQLDKLITIAIEIHPTVELASAQLRKAAENALLARSALYPHFNFEAEIFREKVSQFTAIPGELTYFKEAGLDLVGKYNLDLWNKNRSLFYSELDEVMAAVADRYAAELLLATAIAEVYFDLQGMLMRRGIARERLETKKKLYSLLQQQFQNGITNQIRLYETDTDIALIEDQIFNLEAQIAIDKHALAALVNNASGCSEKIDIDCICPAAQFCSPIPLPCTLPLDLVARRPEIVSQKWKIQKNCYLMKAAQASFYPNINLMGFIGYRSVLLSKLLQKQSLEYYVDAALDLPLFNAGELQAKLGMTREDLEISIAEYNQFILNAVQEVSDALSNLVTADLRKQNIATNLYDAKQLYALTNLRFTNGIDTNISVFNSLENLYIQQDLATQIEVFRLKAAVALIQAIGGCYHE